MTWLGLLNFVVLQWFGVRLARVMWTTNDERGLYVRIGWKLLHWAWPLTGWWSDYRWIWRRG